MFFLLQNLRTAPQSSDQHLDGMNHGLYVAHINEKPVRIMRGYKLDSPYAPPYGYRYDGMYIFWSSVFNTKVFLHPFSWKLHWIKFRKRDNSWFLGLYQVSDYRYQRGESGFMVYRFYLKRIPGQAPPPWSPDYQVSNFLCYSLHVTPYKYSSHGMKVPELASAF